MACTVRQGSVHRSASVRNKYFRKGRFGCTGVAGQVVVDGWQHDPPPLSGSQTREVVGRVTTGSLTTRKDSGECVGWGTGPVAFRRPPDIKPEGPGWPEHRS